MKNILKTALYCKVSEKILKYLNQDKLPILDNGEPMKEFYPNNYEAVSMDYIYRYVLKRRYRKSIVAFVLIELTKDKQIDMIPCGYADNILFCCKRDGAIYIVYRIDKNNKITKRFFGDVSPYFEQKWKKLLKLYNHERNTKTN